MTDLPMTTYGGDGKALQSSEIRPMEDHTEETTEAEQFNKKLCKIAKGELTAESPTAEEIFGKAEGQFSECKLVDEDTTHLLEVFEGEL